MFFFRAFSKLPLSILYLLSNFIYFLLYYIFQYRKEVVIENLKKSFPAAYSNEINVIAKNFYLNLSDIIVETIKALSISEKDLKARVEVNGMEILNAYLSNGQSVVVLTSHLCNWEWMLLRAGISISTEIEAVYQEINNPFFDYLMKKIRSRFNTSLISMKELPRNLVKKQNISRAIALLADQTPAPENAYWTNFLNRETSFYLGPAKIALKMGYPIINVEMIRIKRGYYKLLFEKLYEKSSPIPLKAEEIMEKYVRLTEKSIRAQPSNWLWSHKRWKHNRQDYIKKTISNLLIKNGLISKYCFSFF